MLGFFFVCDRLSLESGGVYGMNDVGVVTQESEELIVFPFNFPLQHIDIQYFSSKVGYAK